MHVPQEKSHVNMQHLFLMPVVVCVGRGVKVDVVGRSVAWAWGRLHLRAQPSEEQVRGLRGRLHLRAPPSEDHMQGLQATKG